MVFRLLSLLALYASSASGLSVMVQGDGPRTVMHSKVPRSALPPKALVSPRRVAQHVIEEVYEQQQQERHEDALLFQSAHARFDAWDGELASLYDEPEVDARSTYLEGDFDERWR